MDYVVCIYLYTVYKQFESEREHKNSKLHFIAPSVCLSLLVCTTVQPIRVYERMNEIKMPAAIVVIFLMFKCRVFSGALKYYSFHSFNGCRRYSIRWNQNFPRKYHSNFAENYYLWMKCLTMLKNNSHNTYIGYNLRNDFFFHRLFYYRYR